MIAYNKTGLDNAIMLREARTAYKKGLLSPEEFTAIKTAYPEILYTPNLFIQIGLFIATTIITQMGFGLVCLLLQGALTSEGVVGVICIFCGLCFYAALEMWVKEKNHFSSGVDEALMWVSGILILAGVFVSGNFDTDMTLMCAVTCLLATWFTFRFADMLIALTAFLSFVFFKFLLAVNVLHLPAAVIPFLVMAISGGVYFLSARMEKQHRFRHYSNALNMLSAASLIMLYLAGNYFVVTEVGAEMLGLTGGAPLGWFFWILTVSIPLVYIYLGVRFKDKIRLRTGIILVAMIVFTIRYYHSVLPLETAMALGGIGLIALAWIVIRYLKTPKYGFTYAAEEEEEMLSGLKAVESVVIAQTFQQTGQPDESFRFGGGSSGGAGAGGDY